MPLNIQKSIYLLSNIFVPARKYRQPAAVPLAICCQKDCPAVFAARYIRDYRNEFLNDLSDKIEKLLAS